ncbi:hypothetical protein BGZ99_000817 [Dissophora globulifera]|uniref:Uncharacterized protein n=1 Tax=Dissophora globulifera TaxID=979702 RepID=A0A9P6RS16_9FUNG|nr:hypothetical protein BGZ99_000817 [Dissophora globulifera]
MDPRTPENLRPGNILRKIDIKRFPTVKLKTIFFEKTHPSRWLVEEYVKQGYGELGDFVDDLRRLATMRTPAPSDAIIKKFCHRLWIFFTSEDGILLLERVKAGIRLHAESDLFAVNATVARYRDLRDGMCLLRGHAISGLDNISDEGMSLNESRLYERILFYLAKEQLSEMEFKDMFVALTGIIDLRVASYKDMSSVVPALNAKDPEIEQLLQRLSKDLRLGLRTLVLKCDVRLGEIARQELGGEDPTVYAPIIQLIRYLTNLIDQGTTPVSESEIVAVWKASLEILSHGKLKFLRQKATADPGYSGEHICRATQMQKRLFMAEFEVEDAPESGRRVDLLLRIDDLEVLNTEAKVNGDPRLGDLQYKKNIRINHAILQDAARHEIELPSMLPLDIRGMSAMVCCIKKADKNILIAGPANSELIVLPSTKDELVKFLAGHSPQMLWNYVHLLLDYQKHIERLVEKKRSASVTTPKKRPAEKWDADTSDGSQEQEERRGSDTFTLDQEDDNTEDQGQELENGEPLLQKVKKEAHQDRRQKERTSNRFMARRMGPQPGELTFFTPRRSKKRVQ